MSRPFPAEKGCLTTSSIEYGVFDIWRRYRDRNRARNDGCQKRTRLRTRAAHAYCLLGATANYDIID